CSADRRVSNVSLAHSSFGLSKSSPASPANQKHAPSKRTDPACPLLTRYAWLNRQTCCIAMPPCPGLPVAVAGGLPVKKHAQNTGQLQDSSTLTSIAHAAAASRAG